MSKQQLTRRCDFWNPNYTEKVSWLVSESGLSRTVKGWNDTPLNGYDESHAQPDEKPVLQLLAYLDRTGKLEQVCELFRKKFSRDPEVIMYSSDILQNWQNEASRLGDNPNNPVLTQRSFIFSVLVMYALGRRVVQRTYTD